MSLELTNITVRPDSKRSPIVIAIISSMSEKPCCVLCVARIMRPPLLQVAQAERGGHHAAPGFRPVQGVVVAAIDRGSECVDCSHPRDRDGIDAGSGDRGARRI